MTYEDVRRIRQNPTAEDVDNEELKWMIDRAIDRRIPASVKWEEARHGIIRPCCPNCLMWVREEDGFCKYCGQALKWGDE